jgi:hypothetical protein
MNFDPSKPIDIAVWEAEDERARRSLRIELESLRGKTIALTQRLDAGSDILGSDTRTLTAMAFELSARVAAVQALRRVRPHGSE